METKPAISKDYGDYINRLMRMRGITQKELAVTTGISTGSISRIINNAQPLTLDHAKKIADALNTTTDDILSIGHDDGVTLAGERLFFESEDQVLIWIIENQERVQESPIVKPLVENIRLKAINEYQYKMISDLRKAADLK